ncbi:hypothetical protein HYW76_00235 [Candidatus Pacearchaeota archaeon]|nr:hypothetical protein [Candidatus Pacearchaeota archaeon]
MAIKGDKKQDYNKVISKIENDLKELLKIINLKYEFYKATGNFRINNDFYKITYTIRLLSDPPLTVGYPNGLEPGEIRLDLNYFKKHMIIDDSIRYKEKHPFLSVSKGGILDG